MGDAKTHTMGRYYKHNWAGKPNKPVRHEAMMAARPKHIRMIKYETWMLNCNTGVLTVEFGGRFKMRCIVYGKSANQWNTAVFFTHDCPTGHQATCEIVGDFKSVREYCWADSTGPKVGSYTVKDDTAVTAWGAIRFVDINVNDCLTVAEYEMIRETIAWTWNAIDSGDFEFPQGHAYNRVALKTA